MSDSSSCDLYLIHVELAHIKITSDRNERAWDLYHLTALVEAAKSLAPLDVIGHGKVPYQKPWLKSMGTQCTSVPRRVQSNVLAQCTVATERGGIGSTSLIIQVVFLSGLTSWTMCQRRGLQPQQTVRVCLLWRRLSSQILGQQETGQAYFDPTRPLSLVDLQYHYTLSELEMSKKCC